MARSPVKGSKRDPLPGARAIEKADPTERLEVSILLRRQTGDTLKDRMLKMIGGDRSTGHMSREDFATQYGASTADINAVTNFAGAHGLTVVQTDAARRTVVLSGTVAQFNAAFDVDLQTFEHPGGTYRGRTGEVHVPDELANIVEAVLGLDNRPQARPHFRGRANTGNIHWNAAASASSSFTPTQLATLYNFPAGTGQGQCIGIIELGGGYRTADLKTYFAELGITHSPNVTAVSIDHGRNHATGDANGPDGEVMLDIEVAGAVAPGASIVVYFAPNTDQGFLDAITTAVHDTKYRPSVISISWGGPEANWTQQSMTAFDQAFQAAAAMGVTICAASGDNGSSDGLDDKHNHVDFPASSPYVLACGGTKLSATGNKIAAESAWNEGANGGATGGGISTVFTRPPWQEGLSSTASGTNAHTKLTMRGVPDVAGDADPYSGYDVRVDGQDTVIGGTSAVAPLWAGLIAIINANSRSQIGYINPLLYKNAAALNDVTGGNNGSYAASTGWDACTGLGTPNGQALLAALTGTTAKTPTS